MTVWVVVAVPNACAEFDGDLGGVIQLFGGVHPPGGGVGAWDELRDDRLGKTAGVGHVLDGEQPDRPVSSLAPHAERDDSGL